MEKETDLVCEKCGKPLVIKWGKHGSFLACTGYPDFSPRGMEADFGKLQQEASKRQERAKAEREKRLAKLRAKYPGHAIDWTEEGGWRLFPIDMEVRNVPKELAKIDEAVAERRQKDREHLEGRLQKMVARQKQIPEFYDLQVQDTPSGPAVTWQAKPNLCTYTRELTVDLPDVDKINWTEQGEEEYCENCGRPMVLKKGRFGTFFACTGYPDCKTTKQIGGPQKKADVPLDEQCPNCGSGMVLKSGRFGEFTACSNYPTCKYVKQKTIGVKCPECSDGEVVERRSRKGKTFYGCNRYPDCKFVAWGKPVQEKCPECGNSYMIEKWLKAGPVWQCPNEECKHKQDAPQPVEA
jgi:DNA topoisomerase-1